MDYYFIKNGQQAGPMSKEELLAQPLTPDTKIWHDGLSEWTELRNDYDLYEAFTNRSTPPPVFGQAPQYSQVRRDMEPKPPTYLAWSIINTLICCMISGIIAIIYSTGVDSAYHAGRYDEARHKSKVAYQINLWTTILCGIGIVLYVVLIFGLAAFGNL